FKSCFFLFLSKSSDPTKITVSSHQNNIDGGRRKIPIHTFFLRNISHLLSLLFEEFAKNNHTTRNKLDNPEDGFDQRGLSGAIRTNNCHENSFRNFQIHVP